MNLGWCERVTAAGVAALAAGCPGLRALDLCGCIWVSGSQCAQGLQMVVFRSSLFLCIVLSIVCGMIHTFRGMCHDRG